MKRNLILFLFFSFMTLGLCLLLNNTMRIGSKNLPPLGKFFSPFTGFWKNAESPGYFKNKTFKNNSLRSAAQIKYDERLVPHIFADNIEDAIYLQGYLHARFRLFQMDISTRAAAGRVSEILGPDALENDRYNRHLGMSFAAENAVKGWKKFRDTYPLLENYAHGINDYIQSLDEENLPIEFKLLNYKPEPWSVYKSALFFKNMAQTLCSGNDDLEASNMLKILGRSQFDHLYPEYNPKQRPVIPDELLAVKDISAFQSQKRNSLNQNSLFPPNPLPKSEPGIGSNNWAVNGKKTQNEAAILCNDPHLSLTLPSIWFEIQIHIPEMNVYGVSLPGLPGIIIGFNEHIAWGVTNVGHDVLDWYKIKWVDDEQTKYELDGKLKEVGYREETYKIKGKKSFRESIKYTDFGPIIPPSPKWKDYEGMAIRWLAHDVPDLPEMAVFLGINKAKNYAEFKKASNNYITPAQNFVFASRDDQIAMRVNGRFPVKPPEDGRFVKDGSSTRQNWKQYIPREEVPQAYNPNSGYVASANQHSTSPSYPYYYTGNFEDYRGRQINEILEGSENLTVEDMKNIQLNTMSLKAKDILPSMLNVVNQMDLSDAEKEIFSALSNWDYYYDSESIAASEFEEWYRLFYLNTFDEIKTLSDTVAVLWPESWRLIEMTLEEPDHLFFDDAQTANIENAYDIIKYSFKNMCEVFNDSTEVSKSKPWWKYRSKNVWHIARIPAFSALNLEVSGHGDVLNAVNGNAGPSWRMIVEMDKDSISAFGVFPGGQSGSPGSRFYKTGMDAWSNGEYFNLHFMNDTEDHTTPILFSEKFKH